ncbi:MAG TPA: ABC transporter substrate-binding protein [Acidimicrobiales bacterium]|nr:ABC transporter substrate-binding protein [Acidimicrobiales bacterium]
MTHRGSRPGWNRRPLFACLILAGLAAGCGAGGSTTTSETLVAVRGGSIALGVAAAPTGCNPHTPTGDSPATRLVLGAVLPSPFVIGPSGAPAPNPNLIVQSELVSTKPETIVYTLNPHAVWSDGVPITAADFIYAWAQQRGDPTSDAKAVSSTAGYRDISSVQGSNGGQTVTVVFHTPFADWQMLFSNLLPAHVMERVGWNPSCSNVDASIDLSGGPFQITGVTPQAIDLSLNPKWWGTVPNCRNLTLRIASDTRQLGQWMQSGYVQVVVPDTVSPAFLTQMSSLPNIESSVDLSNTLVQLEMSAGPDSPLPPDVRFAIALSLNRTAIVTQQASWALASAQVGSSHIYSQGEMGYHPAPSTTTTVDGGVLPAPAPTTTSSTLINQGGTMNFPVTPVPDQAAALMSASGLDRTNGSPWHTDFGVAFPIHLVVDAGDPWVAATAPQVLSELQAAGFNITEYDASSDVQAGEIMANGYADLALLPRTSSPFLSQSLAWYTTLLGPPGQNGSEDWTGYSNATFNQLVTTASQQLNPNTAATDYLAADTQLWTDLVAVPLFTEPSTLLWNRSVGGVVATPTSDSLLWYAQYWAVRVAEPTNNTTPSLPGP